MNENPLQRWITRQFAMRARLINVLSGLLLLGVGIYDFSVNWPLLKVYLNWLNTKYY